MATRLVPAGFKLFSGGSFLVGIVAAPIAAAVAKPLLRGTVRSVISVGLQVKKLAAEAAEELQDLAAEVSAEADSGVTASAANSPSPAPATATAQKGTASAVSAPRKP